MGKKSLEKFDNHQIPQYHVRAVMVYEKLHGVQNGLIVFKVFKQKACEKNFRTISNFYSYNRPYKKTFSEKNINPLYLNTSDLKKNYSYSRIHHSKHVKNNF